jgi:hypothetical protein
MKNVIGIVCFVFLVVQSQADVLIGWDVSGVDVEAGVGVSGVDSGYALLPATKASNVQGGALTLGFNAPSALSDVYGVKYNADLHQTTLADAIDNNHYIQFNLTALSGYRFDLVSIEMSGASGSSGPDSVALMASVLGFSAGEELGTLTGRQGVGGGWDTDASGWGDSIDLSAAEFENVTDVTFRLYTWGSTGTASSGIRNLSGNDLVINGTVEAIPEPATMGLFGLAAIGCLARRRFRTD